MSGENARTVERIFEILELMDAEQRPLNVNEIVDWLGFPVSSTAALLRSMVALGILQHDRSSRSYAPTIRLAHLGAWAVPFSLPDQRILSALHAIRIQTGEIVFLAHQNDIRIQYLHVEAGELAGEVMPRVGGTRLLVQSGLGWALMSLLKDRAIQSILRRTNLILQESDKVDTGAVLKSIEKCRSEGYVVSEHTLRLGHGMVAMPILLGGRKLAIGIGAPVARLETSVGAFVDIMRHRLRHHLDSDLVLYDSKAN